MILILAKQFIATQRYRDGIITYEIFGCHMQKMFDMEKQIAIRNDKTQKFVQRWTNFISAEEKLII